mmetsp:Transcript_18774/g.33787  ORF Transcript_18774/g.33787 Transcript_18774/m.33787 type:complete len:204 (+) Transcript_18774:252-863(+)
MGGNYDHQSSSLTEKLISSEKFVKEKAHQPILNQHKRDIIRPFFFLYITVMPLITMIRDAHICPYLHYYIWAIIFTVLSVMQCMSSVVFILNRMKEKTPEDEKCSLENKLLLPTGIIFLLWVGVGIWGVVLTIWTTDSHPENCNHMYADLASQSITTVVIGFIVVLGIIWQKKFAGKVKDPFREAPPTKKKAEDETDIDVSLI